MNIEAIEFAENPEPRCPCVLLLDTSGSMQGERIDALNEGLVTFKESLMKDNLAQKRVEVSVITFDSQVKIVSDFITADSFEPPTLTAQGQTFTGSGIDQALNSLNQRKISYKDNGIAYYRPWVFMITDGEPYGEDSAIVRQAAQRVKEQEVGKKVAFFTVGVEGANIQQLKDLFPVRAPIMLKGLSFQEMFEWLSASMSRVSQSRPNEQVSLAPPGWGNV
jgi:uncharacterized protein YegL